MKQIYKIALAVAAVLAVAYVAVRTYRRSEFTFLDLHDSRYAGPQYDWFKGASLPSEYNGLEATAKALVQVNSPTLFKKGDTVVVKPADSRAGGTWQGQILHVAKRNLILIDRGPYPQGGPWSGTIQLAEAADA